MQRRGVSRPGERSKADSKSPLDVGGAPSFLAIYYQYFDFVWSSAKLLGANSDAIEDVVQDIFIVIHGRLHTLRKPESLRSWIYSIVRRTVSTHRRSTRAKISLQLRVARSAQATIELPATPFELTDKSALVELLARILDELDESKREVFVAAELEEMTAPEIAAALEIPLNTVYSRLRAARQAFEERLARRVRSTKGGEP